MLNAAVYGWSLPSIRDTYRSMLLGGGFLDAARDGHAAVGYREMVWTVVRFAHVARRHALPETCINIIAKLASVSSGHAPTDLADAFAKTLEQVRALQVEAQLELARQLRAGRTATRANRAPRPRDAVAGVIA